MSGITTVPSEKDIRIVEEVPGVPENERWFVTGYAPASHIGNPYPSFATSAEAVEWLRERGITEYLIERFEP